MHANFVWNINYILALHENYAYYYFRQNGLYVSVFTFQCNQGFVCAALRSERKT